MDLEPYCNVVRSIVVQELKGCGWVELIAIPIENPEKATAENIQDTLEAVHSMLYRAEKVELSVQGVQLCLLGLDRSGRTFRVCASYQGYEGPTLVA